MTTRTSAQIEAADRIEQIAWDKLVAERDAALSEIERLRASETAQSVQEELVQALKEVLDDFHPMTARALHAQDKAKAALTAAAEAGEQDEQVSRLIGFTQFDLDKDRKRVEAATIERCKRVIRAYNPHREWALVTMQKLIAALDRMKDEA